LRSSESTPRKSTYALRRIPDSFWAIPPRVSLYYVQKNPRQLLTDRSERPINFFSRHRDIHLHHAHPSSGRSNSVCSQNWDWIRVASCPLTHGIRLYGVEVDETGDTMDSKKRQENQGFPTNPLKTSWGRSSVG